MVLHFSGDVISLGRVAESCQTESGMRRALRPAEFTDVTFRHEGHSLSKRGATEGCRNAARTLRCNPKCLAYSLRVRGGSRFRIRGGGPPGICVGWGFGVDAEIPDIEVHAFFASFLGHHFDEDIFSGRETLGRSEFQPASADAGYGGFYQMLLRADFAGDLAFHIAQDPLTIFDLCADDTKTVRGDAGLLRTWWGVCGTFHGGRIRAVGGGVQVDVERRNFDVGLHRGMGAVEF